MATPAVLPPNYFSTSLNRTSAEMKISDDNNAIKKQTKHSNYLFFVYINFTLQNISEFSCFVGRASRYIRVMKTSLMHYLSSIYFVNQPLHVSDTFVAHHQEVHYIYITTGTCCAFGPTNRQLTKKPNTYQLLYIYSIPPDDGLQVCPKHVEVDWRNKLRINSASSWFSLHGNMSEIIC